METLLNYQMSCFGSYSHIRPNPDVISKLMEDFSYLNFIPSTINAATIDVNSGSLKTDSRIQIVSTDKKWNIAIMPNRIDVNYKGDSNNFSISELTSYAQKLMELAIKILRVKSGRLAINCTGILPKANNEILNKFYSKLVNPLEFYQNKEIYEWNIAMTGLDNILLNETLEPTNIITNISLGHSDNVDDPIRVIVVLDINTLQDNMSERFDYECLSQFCIYANENLQLLNSNIEGLWSECQ